MRSVTRSYRYGAALVAAALLAACSGGASGGGLAGSGVTPSTQAGGASATASVAAAQATLAAHKKKQQGKARIMITIPPVKLKLTPISLDKSKPHGKRSPKYISASTQSMTVVVSGESTQTFNLTPTSPGCSTSDGSTSCSETAFFPTGQQTVTITLYDQQNGAGNPLSTASTSVTIAAGAVTDISITLDGVPVTAAVLLNGSSSGSVPQGTATSVPATVTAYDADNNVIMTPGNYSTPVTLSDSDTSGDTSLSATSVTAPGTSITVSYNGGSISSATITPSINGTAQSSGAATLSFIALPAITEYSIPTAGSTPEYIAEGPDGALWFSANGTGQIDRITTDGTITGYAATSRPYGIALGSDQALWFTDDTNDLIGRITTAGALTQYSVPTAGSEPWNIAAGPDGALWFTEDIGNKIGQITTGGSITEYSIPTSASTPRGITAGPDGALWFTEYAGTKIGRITTAGGITEYTIPTATARPTGITAGPDGALWFTECHSNKIGRITTAGSIVEYSIPTAGSDPESITAGPDGALWFTQKLTSEIGRITTGGSITEYSTPTASSVPNGITAGPDGALWFTEGANQIGRIPVAIAAQVRRGRRASPITKSLGNIR